MPCSQQGLDYYPVQSVQLSGQVPQDLLAVLRPAVRQAGNGVRTFGTECVDREGGASDSFDPWNYAGRAQLHRAFILEVSVPEVPFQQHPAFRPVDPSALLQVTQPH